MVSGPQFSRFNYKRQGGPAFAGNTRRAPSFVKTKPPMASQAPKTFEIDRLPNFELKRFSPEAAKDMSIRLYEKAEKELSLFKTALEDGLHVLDEKGIEAFKGQPFEQLEARIETLKTIKRRILDIEYWMGFDVPGERREIEEYLNGLCRKLNANRAAIFIEGSIYLHGFSQHEREQFISYFFEVKKLLLAPDPAIVMANDLDETEAKELIKKLGISSVCHTWWDKIIGKPCKQTIDIFLYKNSGLFSASDEKLLGDAVVESKAIPEKLQEAISQRFKTLHDLLIHAWEDSTIESIKDYYSCVASLKNIGTKEEAREKIQGILGSIQMVMFNFPLAKMGLNGTLKPEKLDVTQVLKRMYDVHIVPLQEQGVKISLSLPPDKIFCTMPEPRLAAKIREGFSIASTGRFGPSGEVNVKLNVSGNKADLITRVLGMSFEQLDGFAYQTRIQLDD